MSKYPHSDILDQLHQNMVRLHSRASRDDTFPVVHVTAPSATSMRQIGVRIPSCVLQRVTADNAQSIQDACEAFYRAIYASVGIEIQEAVLPWEDDPAKPFADPVVDDEP